jgi:hypothetical protein
VIEIVVWLIIEVKGTTVFWFCQEIFLGNLIILLSEISRSRSRKVHCIFLVEYTFSLLSVPQPFLGDFLFIRNTNPVNNTKKNEAILLKRQPPDIDLTGEKQCSYMFSSNRGLFFR